MRLEDAVAKVRERVIREGKPPLDLLTSAHYLFAGHREELGDFHVNRWYLLFGREQEYVFEDMPSPGADSSPRICMDVTSVVDMVTMFLAKELGRIPHRRDFMCMKYVPGSVSESGTWSVVVLDPDLHIDPAYSEVLIAEKDRSICFRDVI